MYEVYFHRDMDVAEDVSVALGWAVWSAALGRPASVVRDGELVYHVEVGSKRNEDDSWCPAIVHLSEAGHDRGADDLREHQLREDSIKT